MKKKILGLLAVFALVITGLFGFVGCGEKKLKDEDVVGKYSVASATLTSTVNGETSTQTMTKAQFDEMDQSGLEYFAYAAMFMPTYEVKADKTIVVSMEDESESIGTWSIENNAIKFVPAEGSVDEGTTISVAYDNGSLIITVTYASGTEVLTLTKNA